MSPLIQGLNMGAEIARPDKTAPDQTAR